MAMHLQPPDRLGEGESYNALAKSVGQNEGNLHRPRRTNPRRILTTLQGVR